MDFERVRTEQCLWWQTSRSICSHRCSVLNWLVIECRVPFLPIGRLASLISWEKMWGKKPSDSSVCPFLISFSFICTTSYWGVPVSKYNRLHIALHHSVPHPCSLFYVIRILQFMVAFLFQTFQNELWLDRIKPVGIKRRYLLQISDDLIHVVCTSMLFYILVRLYN